MLANSASPGLAASAAAAAAADVGEEVEAGAAPEEGGDSAAVVGGGESPLTEACTLNSACSRGGEEGRVSEGGVN